MPFTKILNEGEENQYTKEIEIPTEIPSSKVRFFDIVIPIISQVIQKSSVMKIWICPECNSENIKDETKLYVPQNVNPFFLKVVWDTPLVQSGISNRLGFDEIFHDWFDTFLKEINWQEVLYRKEYKAQNGFDMEESGYKDKGDQK